MTRSFLLVQALTVVRLPLAAGVAWLLIQIGPTAEVLWICLGLLLAMEVTDSLDGWLARRSGVVSFWGQIFDPYVDSLSRLIVYWSLAVSGLTLGVVPLVMAIRDVTVAYSRLLMSRRGRSVSARWSGKIKAWIQGLGAVVLLATPVTGTADTASVRDAVSWLVVTATAVSAVEYVRAAIRGGIEFEEHGT